MRVLAFLLQSAVICCARKPIVRFLVLLVNLLHSIKMVSYLSTAHLSLAPARIPVDQLLPTIVDATAALTPVLTNLQFVAVM